MTFLFDSLYSLVKIYLLREEKICFFENRKFDKSYLYIDPQQTESIVKHQSRLTKIEQVKKQFKNFLLKLAISPVPFSHCTPSSRNVQVKEIERDEGELGGLVFCPVVICWKTLNFLNFSENLKNL